MTRPAEVGAARRLVGRRGEARVAAPAARAAHREQALACLREVAEQRARLLVGHDGADGHAEHEVVAAGAGAVAALTVLATLGLVVALVVVIEKRGERRIGFEEDRAAGPSVAPIGAATRHELLAAEEIQPAPPSPPLTKMSISSTNISVPAGRRRPLARSGRAGDDAHVAVVAAALEPYVAVDLRKQRVVRAEAGVQAGAKPRAALPDENAAACHELA